MEKLESTGHISYEPNEKSSEYIPDTRFVDEKTDNTGSENNFKENMNWKPSDIDTDKDISSVVSVFDVSAYILKKLGPVTTMKLHKIVYYCQAWSLVWDEKPLFFENIEAWANGPVVRELFAYHRGIFKISSVTVGNLDLLDADQKETIDAVIDYYGDKSSQWLIDLSHAEDPWKKARVGIPMSERSSSVIAIDDMAEYYSSLQNEE